MNNLNFNEQDKALITEAENKRGYTYYEFTEEKIREIAAKPAQTIEYKEWCCLVQMLYPRGLICSGLFDPFLVFDIVDGKRKDPPRWHWGDLQSPGGDGSILLGRIIRALAEHGIEVHESWHKALAAGKEKNNAKNDNR